jgi:hypothetical protein
MQDIGFLQPLSHQYPMEIVGSSAQSGLAGEEKSLVLVIESVNCIVTFSAEQGNSIIR